MKAKMMTVGSANPRRSAILPRAIRLIPISFLELQEPVPQGGPRLAAHLVPGVVLQLDAEADARCVRVRRDRELRADPRDEVPSVLLQPPLAGDDEAAVRVREGAGLVV